MWLYVATPQVIASKLNETQNVTFNAIRMGRYTSDSTWNMEVPWKFLILLTENI
jgi:hypothetical protein